MAGLGVVEHPESVTILALAGDGSLVVVVQTRAGAGGQTVELPAGCVEPGEEPLAAAVRELREECSLAAAQWRSLGVFWAAPAYSTERVHVYEARTLDTAQGRLEPDEDITVEHRPLEALPAALSDATSIAGFALWVNGAARDVRLEGDGPSA